MENRSILVPNKNPPNTHISYEVMVIQDAVIAETASKKEEMLKKYEKKGIELVTSGSWQ